MRPAISCAAMVMIIAAARATTMVLSMDGIVHATSPVVVEPHTAAHLMVVFADLPTGCVIQRGCDCYRWSDSVHVVRFPPQIPGIVVCHNVSAVLARSTNTMPSAALLPRCETPILWHILRNKACPGFRANPSISDAIVESMVAASVLRTKVCVRAGLTAETVVQARSQESSIGTGSAAAVLSTTASCLLIAAIHAHTMYT